MMWTLWKLLSPSIPLSLLSRLFTSIAHGLFLASFLVAFCFYMGWVKRWLWLFAENELTKLTNGTPVTIGSLEYDLLKGNATATNVVLHQPQREEWKWDSPLLARIGRIHAEVNVPNLLYQILVSLLWTFQPPGSEPQSSIEVYTVLIWDAQVFIERRQYVFNFYLLEVPDPTEILKDEEDTAKTTKTHTKKKKKQISTSVMNLTNEEHPSQRNNNNNNNLPSGDKDTNNSIDDDDGTSSIATDVSKEHANQLVNQMFSAVNSISLAAQQGSLKQQLLEQKNKFADRLKELQKGQGENFKVSDTVQQGARVMKHMSTAVATQTQGVQVLPQVPKKKQLGSSTEDEKRGASSSNPNRTVEEPREELPPYVRIGRVVLKDVRIFTRYSHEDGTRSHEEDEDSDGDDYSMGEEKKVEDDIASNSSEEHDDEVVEATQYGVEISRSATPTMMNLTPERPTAAPPTSTTSTHKPTPTSGWNKPIYLEDVTVRAAELCPPMSLLDPETKLPAIYQRLDKVIDVVFKRILTEIAKSNTGKLLNTAMGELTSFIRISKSSKTSSATSSSNTVKFASHTTKGNNEHRTTTSTTTSMVGEQSQHEKVSISSSSSMREG